MAIPLFTGPAGSLPSIRPEDFSSAPELILRARESGANLAESYENVQLKRQQQDINRARLEQAEFDLQQQRELAPLEREAARIRLQQQTSPEFQELQKDKIALEARLTKQQNDFAAIFQGNDPQAKVQAVTSGQFAELFGSNPRLAEYAVRTTQDLMTEEQREGFQDYLGQNWLRQYVGRNQAQLNTQYNKAIAEFVTDEDMQTVWQENFPGQDLRSIPDKVEIRRSDSYEQDENGEPLYGEGRQLKPAKPLPGEPPLGYDLFRKDTNERIARDLTKDQMKQLKKVRSIQYLAGQAGTPLDQMSAADIGVEKARQDRAKVTGTTTPQQGPTPAQSAAITNERVAQEAYFGGAPETGQPVDPRTAFDFSKAPSANTPDVNQRPQEALKSKVLSQSLTAPEVNEAYRKSLDKYKPAAQQKAAGKTDISFAPAIADTMQMFKVDYRPEQIEAPVVARINSEPLLTNQPPIIKALAAVESGGRRDAVSETGVRGLLQVTRPTARQYGLNRDVPEENVQAGMQELYRNLKLVRTTELALAAYNVGAGTILQAIRATGSYDWPVIRDHLEETLRPEKFKEVRDYPERVLNYAAIFAGTAGTEA